MSRNAGQSSPATSIDAVIFTLGRFKLVLPTKHFGLGAKFLGLLFIAFLDPNTREGRVDEDIFRVEGMRFFSGTEGLVEIFEVEVDFGTGVPGGKRIGRRSRRAGRISIASP